MLIELTRVDHLSHQLKATRSDGVVVSVLLDTKTYAFHDFLHFAYEKEAALSHSFWGSLSAGKSLEQMRAMMLPEAAVAATDEIVQTEMITGALTSVMLERASVAQFFVALESMFAARGLAVPVHVTPEFVARVRERLRRLLGEWNALPFGETMKLVWDV